MSLPGEELPSISELPPNLNILNAGVKTYCKIIGNYLILFC